MKFLSLAFLSGLLSLCSVRSSFAEEVRFYRVVAPWVTAVTSVSSDGTITWTNGGTGTNCDIQTTTDLSQNTWADYIQVPVSNAVVSERLFDPTPPVGMVFIPAGCFTMGNCMDPNEGYIWELPLHSVYISAFYMDQCDVTKGQWDSVYSWATNHGYSFDDIGSGKAPNYPVHAVNWYDCVKWCNARSEMTGLTPCYYTSASLDTVYRSGDLDISNSCVNWNVNGYRLPTEAEWEKAARGGLSGQRFPWGDTISESQANYISYWSNGVPYYSFDVNNYSGYNTNFDTGVGPYISPVGYFAPNGYGLYDMAGNVWQWCWDWWVAGWYNNAGATQNNSRGPTSSPEDGRVLRGGSWRDDASSLRCAYRTFSYSPASAYNHAGFRCVRGASVLL